MAEDINKEREPQNENAQTTGQQSQLSRQQSGKEGFGTDSDTLTQQSSRQDTMNQQGSGQSGQDSGFIGSQGSGGDDFVETGQQTDLADEDALTQENDQGMGSSSSEEESF